MNVLKKRARYDRCDTSANLMYVTDLYLTNKKGKTVLCFYKACKEVTRAGECFSLLCECSRHFLECFITEQSTVLGFLFVLQYSFDHICKTTGFSFQENKFIYSFKCAQEKFYSACQRAQNGVTGHSRVCINTVFFWH